MNKQKPLKNLEKSCKNFWQPWLQTAVYFELSCMLALILAIIHAFVYLIRNHYQA